MDDLKAMSTEDLIDRLVGMELWRIAHGRDGVELVMPLDATPEFEEIKRRLRELAELELS